MKKLLALVLFLIASLAVRAQSGVVTGRVRDLITENGVDSASVTLLTADSTKISGVYAEVKYGETQIDGKSVWAPNPKDGAKFQLKVPRPGHYIICCMADGYQTAFFPVEVEYSATKTTFDAGDLYIKEKSTQISEAVVTGTRIKMFYKGDTLVYNASAFQLPDGSMLNDLVRQLPGAELRDDGNVYVNGRMVENLLLGGKDFFNGDPQAALANLPAYVVNRVKVYEKSGEKSQTVGASMGDEQYVMDVQLKRKYIGTYLGRIVAGYGTEDRYQAGLFLMRFDDRQSFNLMGDFNNRSQTYQYSRRGESGKSDPSGENRRNCLALNYQYEPHGRLRFTAGATYRDNSSHDDGGASRENYLAGGNTFARTATSSYADNMTVAGDVRLTLRPRQGHFYEFHYAADYLKRDGHSSERTANYRAEPPDMDFYALLDSTFKQPLADANLRSVVASRLRNEVLFDGKNLRHEASARMHRAFSGNLLSVDADFMADNRVDHRYDLYDLKYSRSEGQPDFRHRYEAVQTDNYRYHIKATYDWKFRQTEEADGLLSSYYGFQYERKESDNPLYRLDALGGGWADFDQALLGTLPSARDELARTMSEADSYWATLRQMKHLVGLNWRYGVQLANRRWLKVNTLAEVTWQDDDYDYLRYGTNHPVRRSSWLPSFSLALRYHPRPDDIRGMQSRWELSLASRETQADARHLIDITDASDPLNVHQGNARLQNPWRHEAALAYVHSFGRSNAYLYNALKFTLWQNEVAISSIYDRTTGVCTTRPVNIDGNWIAKYELFSNVPLDKQQRWLLVPLMLINYSRSADLSRTTDEEASSESDVRSLSLAVGANLRCSPAAWFNLFGQFKAEWNHVDGSRPQFETISATTLLYSLQATVNLPARFMLYADCAVISRYGFNDPSLNDTRATINLSVERTIKNFTLKLQGCDLLARNRYTTTLIDAQGRTETFATCLPRYYFFSLTWKFNKKANRK